MTGKLAKERGKAYSARCAANRMREQIGDVRAQRDAARKQRDLLLKALKSAVKTSEYFAEDDECCQEWQSEMQNMRAAIAAVEHEGGAV